ncbi:hypothetical protein [Rheinheimera hassiensis]|uniref:hypothetical protein n=1 Tax=Rheinheimera hassiensis TaxID=1193627 RepID=UPI001F051E9B|nr:hypothetical protein [Rheinheimera hassiensis]
MPDTTSRSIEKFIAHASREANRAPLQREDAFELGSQAAKDCIDSGVPIDLRDEAPGMALHSDAEAMGWNTMVFSPENKALRQKGLESD